MTEKPLYGYVSIPKKTAKRALIFISLATEYPEVVIPAQAGIYSRMERV